MPKCDFNKVCNCIGNALWHGCSVKLQHIFRAPFPEKTYAGLLLQFFLSEIIFLDYNL